MAEAGLPAEVAGEDVSEISPTQGASSEIHFHNDVAEISPTQGASSETHFHNDVAEISPTQGASSETHFHDDVAETSPTQGTSSETHFYYHDRRVINQGSIGHLSTGDDNRRYTTSAKQELVNQLEKDTLARVTSWTAGMVKIAALNLLLSMIWSGSRWITVRGSPGEGKTTLAYQALLELSRAGRRVFQAWKPEELSAVLQECHQSTVVMVDDIFGQLSFDLDNWKKWEVELHKILGETEHHSLQPSQTPKKDVVVIVVGRDYVFNSALCNVGKYSQFLTEVKYVINMTVSNERDYEEKLSIWNTLSTMGGVEVEKKTVYKICNIQCPHGFPHVCKLFITMFKHDNNLKAEAFFKSPLEFLNQTVARFMENDDLFELFKELIVGDGKVSVRQLGQLVRSRNIIKAGDDLVGSYLKKENFEFEFDHPSIFDSVAFQFCNSHLDVVIQKCPMSFLHERIRLKHPHGTPSSENNLVVYIPRSYMNDLSKRFVTEVSMRNFSKVLSHQAMRDVEFVKKFISSLPHPRKLMYETDITYHKLFHFESICRNEGSFLYFISSSQSPLLLQHIERHTKRQLSPGDIETVMAGACVFAATDVVTYLMSRHNIDINMQPGQLKRTPLMIAAKSGNGGFIDTMIDMKPDVWVIDVHGETALHHLSYNGVVSAVSRVIDMGCEVNVKGWVGQSPLYEACLGNQTAVVRVLLERGASVDSDAVETACESGIVDIVTLLFDKGAKVDMKTFHGSPLHSACHGHSLTVMEYLIEKGASVNKAGRRDTSLHMACRDGWHQGVQWLLEHGADMKGSTPLHWAAKWGSHECVDVLLKAGANVNIQDKTGSTPLRNAGRSGSHECVEMLIKAGANVNIQDESGSTPLHKAGRSGSHKCVEMLINAGSNVNIQDEDGSTPLHMAAWMGLHECVEMLVKAGADIRIVSTGGRTPLHSAVKSDHHIPNISVCQTLITQGVDVNSVDREGNTALHLLCQVQSDTKVGPSRNPASYYADEYRRLVEMFVSYGADTQTLNKRREPALRGWCREL